MRILHLWRGQNRQQYLYQIWLQLWGGCYKTWHTNNYIFTLDKVSYECWKRHTRNMRSKHWGQMFVIDKELNLQVWTQNRYSKQIAELELLDARCVELNLLDTQSSVQTKGWIQGLIHQIKLMSMGNWVVDKPLQIEHHVNKPIGARDIVYITLPHLWVLPFYKWHWCYFLWFISSILSCNPHGE